MNDELSDIFHMLDEALRALGRLTDIQPATQGMTLLAWLCAFIDVYKSNTVAPETFKQMRRNIRLHIAPNLPDDLPLKDVRPMDIQKVLNAIPAPRTRESVHNLLSGAFRQAVAEQLIEYNPMSKIKSCKAKRHKGTALTLEEQSEFMRAIHGAKLEHYYLFCLYSGCRRNEALAVHREDIDEQKHVIHIRGTKTVLSDRYIPIFDGIQRLLPELPNTGALFPFQPDYVSKNFKKYCANHTLHDLRHTFATRALEADIPMKVVQTWLGHSEIATTADIYSDVSIDYSLREAAKLNAVLEPRN
ncbi:MAG: site-specific integrase [Roseburia sp.]|nr:site-specific integrase [Roseburia sp.]